MKEAIMSVLGEVAIAIVVFLAGMMLSINLMNKDCASGKPTIIDGKVYRCAEVRL